MAVKTQCTNPQCGKTYKVDDALLGRTTKCKHCGQPFTISESALDTPLPAGQTQMGQTPPALPEGTSGDVPKKLGRFEIRSRLGVGAFGAVYRAYDPVLEREVALKVPRAAVLEKPEARARFLREPKAAAQLRHPNIVPIFDAGSDGEHYYIASAYIEGRTLEDVIDEERPDFRRSAEIVRDLAGALEYADSMGVVHRDVKPANIMIDARGDALLMDFGLARLESAEEKLTQDGSVMGTPAYMAPEQADSSLGEVSPASDQYSLGVVLYELLCGERPFSGPPTVLLYNVVHEEPPSPRATDPRIPRDLETICLKAMAKRPQDRYANCGAVVEDLRHWLSDEPIQARPLGPIERMARWSRRNPMLAAAVGIVVAVTLAALIAVSSAWRVAQTSRQLAEKRLLKVEELQRETEDALKVAERQTGIAQRKQAEAEQSEKALQEALTRVTDAQRREREASATAATEEVRATTQQQRADTLEEEVTQWEGKGFDLYRERIMLAQQKRLSDEFAEATAILDGCPPQFRHWEWGFLRRACESASPVVLATNPSNPDLAVEFNTPVIVTYTPDGERLLCQYRSGDVHVWRSSDGELLRTLAGPPVAPMMPKVMQCSLTISADSQYIAAIGNDQRVTVWNAEGKVVLASTGHRCHLSPSIFSSDGRYIALGCLDGTVKVWDLLSGLGVFQASLAQMSVSGTAFGRENAAAGARELLAVAYGSTIEIWDIQRGARLSATKGAGSWIRAVDSRLYTKAAGGILKVGGFFVRDGGPLSMTSLGIPRELLLLSPDARLVSYLADDNSVEIYHASRTRQSLAILPAHHAPVKAIAFGPDGLIATATEELIKLWMLAAIARREPQMKLIKTIQSGGCATPFSLAFHPDGKDLAVGFENEVKICNVPRWVPQPFLADGEGLRYSRYSTGTKATFSPDGEHIGIASSRRSPYRSPSGLIVADLATREQLFTLTSTSQVHGDGVWAYSPDGRRIACAHTIWNAATGEELLAAEEEPRSARFGPSFRPKLLAAEEEPLTLSTSFSPDGKRIAEADRQGGVRIWDTSSGRTLLVLDVRQGGMAPSDVFNVKFGPLGDVVATASGALLRLWDASSGKNLFSLDERTGLGHIFDFAFSPDGSSILVAGRDALKFYDVSTGEEVRVLSEDEGAAAVEYSPDGRRIVSSRGPLSLSIWDARTGQCLLALTLGDRDDSRDAWLSAYNLDLEFSPNGLHIAVEGRNWQAARWQLQDTDGVGPESDVPAAP